MAYSQPPYQPNGAFYPPGPGHQQQPYPPPPPQYQQQQHPQHQQQQQYHQNPYYTQQQAPYPPQQQQYQQPQQHYQQQQQQQPFPQHPSLPPRQHQSATPSSSASASGPAHVPASGAQDRPDALPEQALRALAAYGSPFAHSKDWAATRDDTLLLSLPKQAFKMRVKQRFARSPGDIFNPPAPSFSRPPSGQWSYSPFVPISVKAQGKLLADGFKPLYPGRVLADHDVSAADWARFLEDIDVAGRLSGGQSVFANVAPVTMHLGATGYFITKAIEKGMKRKKIPVIAETVETWQQNFFIPRRLDVYIVEGNERLTARQPGEPVPGTPLAANVKPAKDDQKSEDSSDDDSDSSDSSDDDDEDGGHGSAAPSSTANTEGLTSKQLRRQRKRERKAARRENKKERKEKRREKKNKRKEVKRSTATIVIAPIQ
ncbi:uncharacterized protein PFL1_00023 [Pseudozyma flocculosa PF-1]|uniref:Uncharacterized protein n=1 Tax=Pseudozyma flocculosa TaxID=84751 RepID=A0A5C3ETV1_9BASI|nr:uncharacterized protein PFL1_00023 [Pseudozyma flocculosa PF-1]EPQ31824.1 hypothetical protein PFL1_00023 [Pseudozyma flocculosa PF-1]SPO35280.1 uncharacterized protein PSFLO_00751 [Pseudozyma flocculosa]